MRTCKRILSLVLSAALLSGLFTLGASAYSDVAGDHPARAAIQRWTEYGLIIGNEKGDFEPEGSLTRAAFATILDRLMGYQVRAENTFSDLKEGDWYLDAVLRLNAAGVLEGSGGRAMPNSVLTRQEAAALAGRVLDLDKSDKELTFADKKDVADWAVGWVAALVARGCFAGEAEFRPADPMTRAEAVSMLDTLISAFVHADGTYSADAAGDVVVNARDVTLKDMKIGGDLIVADGVADGDVYLDHVTVAGKIVLRGGGDHSFHLLPGTVVEGTIIVTKTASGGIRLVNESGKVLPMVNVADGKDGVTLTGPIDAVVVATDAPVELADATVKIAVSVTVPGASVSVTGTSKVEKLDVAGAARDAAISIDKTAKIDKVDVAADGLTLDNQNKNNKPAVTVDKTVTEKPKDSSGSEVKPATPSGGGGGGSYTPSRPDPFTAVAANLASPQAAKTATDAVPAASGYTVATTWSPALVDGKFAKETAYTATLVFSLASSSYQWGDTVSVTVNNSTSYGSAAQVGDTVLNTETKTVTVTAVYEKTAAELALVVDAQPQDVSASAGNTASKSVTVRAHVEADGVEAPNYPVSYQWYQSTQSDMSGKELVPGATAAGYQLPSLEAGTYYFACAMTADGIDETLSKTAKVTVTPAVQGEVVLSDLHLATRNGAVCLEFETTHPEVERKKVEFYCGDNKVWFGESLSSHIDIGLTVVHLQEACTFTKIELTPLNDEGEALGETVAFQCSVQTTISTLNGVTAIFDESTKHLRFEGVSGNASQCFYTLIAENGRNWGDDLDAPEDEVCIADLSEKSESQLEVVAQVGTKVTFYAWDTMLTDQTTASVEVHTSGPIGVQLAQSGNE